MKKLLNYLMQQEKNILPWLTNAWTLYLSLCLSDSLYSESLSLFYFHLPFCRALWDRSACWKHSRNKPAITLVSLHVFCVCAFVCVCIPGAAENAAERKRQRTDAECQPYAVAPSPSRCADRWEPSGWVSWDRRRCVSAPRWGTWVQQNGYNQAEDEWQIYCSMFSDYTLISTQTLKTNCTSKSTNIQ